MSKPRIIAQGKRLLQACRKMEIPLTVFSDHQGKWDTYNSCGSPANSGFINRSMAKKPIELHWSEHELYNQLHLCGLAHEMAHMAFGVDPERADEVDGPMLAFEAALHEHAGIGRRAVDQWMDNFILDNGEAWGNSGWSKKLDVLLHSRNFAVRMQLLTTDGQLTWKSLKPKEGRTWASTPPSTAA